MDCFGGLEKRIKQAWFSQMLTQGGRPLWHNLRRPLSPVVMWNTVLKIRTRI